MPLHDDGDDQVDLDLLDGHRLPDWADDVQPVQSLRKVPLAFHGVLSVILFALGLSVLIISVSGLAKQQGAIEAAPYGTLSFEWLGTAGHQATAGVFGFLLMIFSWVSCIATENGLCGRTTRIILVGVEFALIVSLAVLGVIALREANHPSGGIVQGMETGWQTLVAQEEENGNEALGTGWLCSLQRHNQCMGFHDGECLPCITNRSCGVSTCLLCKGQLIPKTSCGALIIDVYKSWVQPTGKIALLSSLVLSLDLISIIFLLPCFEIRDGSYVIMRRKRDAWHEA
eukprot:CAMPEP_0184680648 /NCGR_PEP_ID=MMETSP0312-20130426/3546_1 /TAXON_ID=31354 /ORGANISM="Compsopogon coeruleus, Strain SAG 36.94" /LENGTH=285 /DNA_ID=CAMNT_0027130917 /DNA_START=289 /DNA_END=1146 /DNA_ORIENTATION=+